MICNNKPSRLIKCMVSLLIYKFTRMYEAIMKGDKSIRKNTAFRATHLNPTAVEDRKI